jgi:hypothetical protein
MLALMGMGIQLAEMIVLEHRHRPIPPVVHTLGRLFTGFDEADAVELLQRHDVEPAPARIEIDTQTLESRSWGKPCITERTFFRMLGAQEVHAIDINTYEGASIAWDLCKPIPDHMASIADFIVGGSTLDNVFDPAQYLRNIARMLRLGGRLFEINHANNHARPYVMLPAPWFFDFFAVNRFSDCRVYMLEFSHQIHVFRLEFHINPKQQATWGVLDNFDADERYTIVTLVFAEKGKDSTWDQSPVQDCWRDQQAVVDYNEQLARIAANPRPDWLLRLSDSKPISPNQSRHNRYRYVGHF